MNKATTNSYFLFFGVPYHLNLDGKISGRGNYGLESFLGGEGGGGGGVIFGPRIFLGFRQETDKSVLIRLHAQKRKERSSAHSMAYSITYRLEMEFFSHNLK